MKYQNTLVKFDEIVHGENPRIPNNLSLDSLIDSIEGVGLLEPVSMYKRTDGKMEIVRGHRRMLSIAELQKRNLVRFIELFGKGIPSLVITGATASDIVSLKLDHSEQRGLSDPHELQRSANMLFAIGKAEAEVSILLAGLIDKISPMSQKVRLEVVELESKLAAAKLSGNADSVTVCERNLRDRISKYRRGFVQGLNNAFRCPDKVMAALYKRAVGTPPEGVTEYLPSLTTVQVTKLWESHRDDLGMLENGAPKYNKAITGPKFNETWAALVVAAQSDDGKEKTSKPKAMAAKEMTEELKNKGYRSEIVHVLTAHHAGGKEEFDIAMLDSASYYGDLLRKHDPKAWGDMAAAAKVIEGRLLEESVKATAAAASVPTLTVVK